MKIVTISTKIPTLNKGGDQLVAFNRITYLKKQGHSIDLICFGDVNNLQDNNEKKILTKKGINVHLIKQNFFETILNLIISFFNRDLPFQCAYYKSRSFQNKIKDLINTKNTSLIYCVMIRISSNINWYKGKLIVELIDSMSLNLKRRIHFSGKFFKPVLKEEQFRAAVYEKKLADKSNVSFITSDLDKKEINSNKINVIPNGVKIFKKEKSRKFKKKIIFTGNMFYQPNKDAIKWFVNNCWEDILQKESKSKLLIVGNNPSSDIILLQKRYSSIRVTGTVKNIKSLICKSSVAIAPMQSGSGIQNKILEAMSCGLPVVTTKIGAKALKANKNKDLLVANNSRDFVNKVIYLLNSKKYNKIIGMNGFKYVSKNHNWNQLNSKFLSSIKKNTYVNS